MHLYNPAIVRNNRFPHQSRNTNIEVLRLVLMVFICFWHIIVHGFKFKLYGDPELVFNIDLKATLFFCTLFAPATYCFMFISGWYGIKFSLRKFLYLSYISVCCYCITVVIRFLMGDIDFWFPIITHVFPIACHKWWFLTGYIMVFLMSPFIEAGIKTMEEKTLKHIFLIMTYLEVASFIILQDNTGRSFFGLLYIYFLARYLRMNQFTFPTYTLIIAYASSFILLWLSAYFACHLDTYKWIAWTSIGSYNNPAIIIMAVTAFFLVLKIKPTHIRWLNHFLENILIIYLLTEGIGTILYDYEAKLIFKNPYQGALFVLMTVLACLSIGKLLSIIYTYSSKIIISKSNA